MKRKILLSVIMALACVCMLAVFCSAETYGNFTYTVSKNEATITGCIEPTPVFSIPSEINSLPVTAIANGAFKDNDIIKAVTIKNGILSIGDEAFAGCDELMSVTIPASVSSIGNKAFFACPKLYNFTVNTSNTTYSASANRAVLFNYDKTVLLQYGMGKTDTTYAIPDNVTTIAEGAFSGADLLTTITVPASVTTMPSDTFKFCGALTAINVDSANTSFASDGGVLFNKAGTTLIQYPVAKTGATYTVPATVTAIDDWAFNGASALTEIVLTNNISNIGYAAFANCTGITEITVPGSVKNIGVSAFSGCTALASAVIENGVEQIGESAFSGCPALENVTIPASVTTIGAMNPATGKYIGAFNGCTGLINIAVDEGNAHFASLDGSLFNKAMTKLIQYATGKEDTTYTVPLYVEFIGEGAFAGSANLTEVVMPLGVAEIGDDAFRACAALENINLPEGLESIGLYAFADCTSLKAVVIPTTVKFIGAYAFSGCDTLKLAKTYTQDALIGKNVFRDTDPELSLQGYSESTTKEYALENSIAFQDVTLAQDVTVNNITKDGTRVTAPQTGWNPGENTFAVYSESPCAVFASFNGGVTYERLEATALEDGGYSFTFTYTVGENVNVLVTKFGDVDADGAFTNADVTVLKAVILGKKELSTIGSYTSDINGDGRVSNADVTRLKAIWTEKVQAEW